MIHTHTAKGIDVKIPQKVFFSKDPVNYTVKNDFYITISKSTSFDGVSGGLEEVSGDPKEASDLAESAVKKGESYPSIYIKGFEQLFDDGITRHDRMDAFFKMFHVNGNKDWDIYYGKFRDTEEECVVITTAALSLEPNFAVGFQLSDKCAFTGVLEDTSPISLDVYIDDFDSLFTDVGSSIHYSLTLERGYAVYIDRLGAYRAEKPDTPVTAVYKGESCYISWKIEQNEKASAFLYDENGAVVANLPPYTARIDKDRQFMLMAYNDYCSVLQFVTVYRTLWKKEEITLNDFPQVDKAGRFKIYQANDGGYFLYVHPKLYTSRDCITWTVYADNTVAAGGYSFYSSSFSENKFSVCYLSDLKLVYCEMGWDDKKWVKYEMDRTGITAAYALLSDPHQTFIVLAARDGIGIYELKGGTLINGRYIEVEEGNAVIAADVLDDDMGRYVAILCSNSRIYFYDLNDGYKNNIFECPEVLDDNIYLLRSNAVYIVLSGYVYEVSDREKFTDMHFFPAYEEGTRPVMGAADYREIIGIFQTQQGMETWKYKF